MPLYQKPADLSEQRHKALQAAMALKTEGCPPYQLEWPAGPEKKREKLVRFVEDELLQCFHEEEEQIFPWIEARSPAGRHTCVTLQMEHELMRKLIAEIQVAKGSDLTELLTDFGVLLEQHVLDEERLISKLALEGGHPADAA